MTKKTKLNTTLKLLEEKNACANGYQTLIDYIGHNYDKNAEINLLTILKSNGINHFFWAFRALQQEKPIWNPVLNNILADIAESVLNIFEEKYTDDKRPRAAIEACRNRNITYDDLVVASNAANAAANEVDDDYNAKRAVYAAALTASVAATALTTEIGAAFTIATIIPIAAVDAIYTRAKECENTRTKEQEKQIKIIHNYLE